MLFLDHLYGTIDFRGTPYESLIYELIGCPEIQRLRHMRLMNFDAPYIQDLASTRRFPHSIGTCYLAYMILEKSSLPIDEKKKIITAALIHDVGILPFGHLLESIIKKNKPNFSHEKIVYSILTGTYHPTNIYHQILGSETLRLSKVLKQHKIDPIELYNLICPEKNIKTLISADIDLDNIDNIHRMASLLGYSDAKSNLNNLLATVNISNKLQLVFSNSSIDSIENWLKMRQNIYTMIIGHPENVPYNAFLSKLLKTAIEKKVVNVDEWYITDNFFEKRLLDNDDTHQLASWLYTKPRFELVDYIWFLSNDKPAIDFDEIETSILEKNFTLPLSLKKADYWFWSENRLISRSIRVLFKDLKEHELGFNSYSTLISLIMLSDYRSTPLKIAESAKIQWRKEIIDHINNKLPNWKSTVKFPKDYNENFFNSKIKHEQLRIF